jgi:hypothetical protein
MYLHVGVEEVLVILSFEDELFVLEFVGWVVVLVPMVLIDPETIIREMIVMRKVDVISLINRLIII